MSASKHRHRHTDAKASSNRLVVICQGLGSVTNITLSGDLSCRYVGEIITDKEANTRGNDSFLFNLDNKVFPLIWFHDNNIVSNTGVGMHERVG